MPVLTALELDQLREEAGRALASEYDAVGGVAPLAGGASREMLAFDVGSHELVLLRGGLADDARMDREWEALTAAHAAGVPVPEPLWRTAELRGIVMRRLPGEAIPRKILRDQLGNRGSDALVAQVAAAAAAVHTVRPADVPGFEVPPGSAALHEIAFMEAELDRLGEPHPALELGLRWLRSRLPVEREPVLVHGDLRLGNMLVQDGSLVALLDWELSHVGNPVDDIGYMCIRSWRFGADDRPAAGFGSRERFLEAYAAAGGAEISAEELRWWEVLGNLKWGVFCVRQAARHLGGDMRSHEHAAIGRRICEPTWDMLEMMA